MTVCLSDSQLHLFLQTQLPVGHIEDCVRGHTPYTVTEAILTYASSNWGLAQAQTQEDDSMKEPSLTISYESMERYGGGGLGGVSLAHCEAEHRSLRCGQLKNCCSRCRNISVVQ